MTEMKANHFVDVNKMVEALRGIGDFAHDKSTGPVVPDALWEIRSMAYAAIGDASSPPQRTWVGLGAEDRWEIIYATERDERTTVMQLVEAKLKEKNT